MPNSTSNHESAQRSNTYKGISKDAENIQAAGAAATAKLVDGFTETASSLAESAQNLAHDAIATARKTGQDGIKQVEKQVQSSPLVALGVAFLGGMLISTLIRRH